MRNVRWLVVTSGFFVSGAGLYTVGCGTAGSDCDLLLCDKKYATDGGEGGSTADAGPDAPVDPDCTAVPSELAGGVLAKCGVFARADAADAGDGTMDKPFKSLQAAVDEAAKQNKAVYACAMEFDEALVVPAGLALYGGLDCDNAWTWKDQSRTTVKPPSAGAGPGGNEIAVLLAGGEARTVMQDFDVIAPEGHAAGVSSIAVVMDGGAADLTRCNLTAGNGVEGAPGPAGNAADLDGIGGDDGVGVCSSGANNPGKAGPVKTCGVDQSAGGKGGDGGELIASVPQPAGAGSDGTPADPNQPALGKGGAGEGAQVCVKGADGAAGANGPPGSGADPAKNGSISSNGFTGNRGDAGMIGHPGQAAGGGGGAKGALAITCSGVTLNRVGSSGGTGATGSCGGQGGEGGFPGGASIALLSLNAIVMLDQVKLTAGIGGNGGVGGDGQPGGAAGFGGKGGMGAGVAKNACSGGDGGQGGTGGPGGGGQGGPSIGIAYSGGAPKTMGGSIAVAPTPAKGGAGGTGNEVPGKGGDGATAMTLSFGQ